MTRKEAFDWLRSCGVKELVLTACPNEETFIIGGGAAGAVALRDGRDRNVMVALTNEFLAEVLGQDWRTNSDPFEGRVHWDLEDGTLSLYYELEDHTELEPIVLGGY